MLRIMGIFCALQVLTLCPTFACDGQPGKVIFEDNFADDTGGWDLAIGTSVKPPALVIALDDKYVITSIQNLTFHATEADFCMDTILPKPVGKDNYSNVGLVFWATDYDNYFDVQLASDGSVYLYSKSNGKWDRIYTVEKFASFKTGPDAVNSLRISTVGGKLITYLNGKQVKAIRAQMPSGNLRFGILGSYDNQDSAYPPIKITDYKVTSGQ